MIRTITTRQIFRITRSGILFLEGDYSAFFYRSDQYWRVNTPFGDFPIVDFGIREPQVRGTDHIPIVEFAWLQKATQEIRVVIDPFNRMETPWKYGKQLVDSLSS